MRCSAGKKCTNFESEQRLLFPLIDQHISETRGVEFEFEFINNKEWNKIQE